MKDLATALFVFLVATTAAHADELPSIPPARPGDPIEATIRKIDGDQITLVRHTPEGDEKEQTLTAAADCTLLEATKNRETGGIEWMPVEGGLKGDIDPKEFVIAHVRINRANKIDQILGFGQLQIGNRFPAVVKKIDGDKVVLKPISGDELMLTAAPDCKVLETKFVKDRPLVTEAVAGGLKAEVFSKGSLRVLIATDKEKNVVEVCILRPNPHLFRATIKKIEGNKLTLIKQLYDGSNGNEEPMSAAEGCEVFEYKGVPRSAKYVKVPYEDALKCEFLTMKRTEVRFHTDKDDKITSVEVVYNPYWYEAMVIMDKPEKARVLTEPKDVTLALTEDCRIFQAKVDRDTAKPSYSILKDGVKGATALKRPFSALVKVNDDNKIMEMRLHRDPKNFVAYVSKVNIKEGADTTLGISEPGVRRPGSKDGGTYGSELTLAKDYKVLTRKSRDGKSTLQPVQGTPLASLEPGVKGPKGGTQFVVARILLGDDGKVMEVQILEGVSSPEEAK